MLNTRQPLDSPSTWLITGGAGYIGSHIADEFLSHGFNVVIVDSLSTGLIQRVNYLRRKYKSQINLVVADIRELSEIEKIFCDYQIEGVIHAAGLKSVTDSIANPVEYMEVNHLATKGLLKLLPKYEIKKFIFSSSAAVYGSPSFMRPVKEDDPKQPISPYGESKLLAEKAVREFTQEAGNFGVSLRYFNVIGAKFSELADNSKNNLVPIVFDKLMNGESPEIFGKNLNTSDGTPVRDYVDVRDVARAHFLASQIKTPLGEALNIGTGKGVSVREIILTISKILNCENVPTIDGKPRPGEPEQLLADVRLAERILAFTSSYSVEASLTSLKESKEHL